MALRKSLRRGSAWVNHSISFRARESMLLADTDWRTPKERHHQILCLPTQAMAFLGSILAGVSVGLTALAEAAGRGQIEIGADKLLHLPPIRPLDEEVEPRKTREAVFRHIGSVQLPELLLEVDATAHFSEVLLARRPSSSNELLAIYGALLAHGTVLDAKGVGSMIPGIDAAHISTAMRAVALLAHQLPGHVPVQRRAVCGRAGRTRRRQSHGQVGPVMPADCAVVDRMSARWQSADRHPRLLAGCQRPRPGIQCVKLTATKQSLAVQP